MRNVIFAALVAVAGIGLPLAARGDDAAISQQIMQTLQWHKQQGNLEGFNIRLQVDNGTVELEGHVSTPQQQLLVLDVARRVPGVRQVINRVKIQPPAQTAQHESRSGLDIGKPASALRNLFRPLGTDSASKPDHRHASGRVPQQSGNRPAAKSSTPTFAAPRLPLASSNHSSRRSAATTPGEVAKTQALILTPSGEAAAAQTEAVPAAAQTKPAVAPNQTASVAPLPPSETAPPAHEPADTAAAKATANTASSIVSRLRATLESATATRTPQEAKAAADTTATAQPKPAEQRPSDEQIAERLVNALQQHKNAGRLAGFDIDLQVDKGVVWLSGFVSDAQQQKLAVETARRIPGVKQVVTDIRVRQAQAAVAAAEPRRPTAERPPVQPPKAIERQQLPASPPPLPFAANPTSRPTVSPSTPQPQLPALAPPKPVEATAGVAPPAASRAETVGSGVATAQTAKSTNEHNHRTNRVSRTPSRVPSKDAATKEPASELAARPTPPAILIPIYGSAPTGRAASQTPLAFAPARTVGHNEVSQPGTAPGGVLPIPAFLPANGGAFPAQHDEPQMPPYAWPTYAPYPNYGAVTYPRQYSPTAWPYIGPFYPYPQVPLGWRKVSLVWKDGWWMLDFKDRH